MSMRKKKKSKKISLNFDSIRESLRKKCSSSQQLIMIVNLKLTLNLTRNSSLTERRRTILSLIFVALKRNGKKRRENNKLFGYQMSRYIYIRSSCVTILHWVCTNTVTTVDIYNLLESACRRLFVYYLLTIPVWRIVLSFRQQQHCGFHYLLSCYVLWSNETRNRHFLHVRYACNVNATCT